MNNNKVIERVYIVRASFPSSHSSKDIEHYIDKKIDIVRSNGDNMYTTIIEVNEVEKGV